MTFDNHKNLCDQFLIDYRYQSIIPIESEVMPSSTMFVETSVFSNYNSPSQETSHA